MQRGHVYLTLHEMYVEEKSGRITGATMNKHLQSHLLRMEQQAQPTHRSFEVWVGTGENDMLGPNGEILSLAEFDERFPDAVDIGGTRPPMVPNEPNAYKE